MLMIFSDEVSEPLARSLLRTRNEFTDEEFAEDRKKALVALAVFSPEIVVTYVFSINIKYTCMVSNYIL